MIQTNSEDDSIETDPFAAVTTGDGEGVTESQLVRLDRFRADNDRWLIVVLDALRYDLFVRWLARREDAPMAVEDVARVRSPGLYSGEWVRACWRGDFADVTYVTGNAYVNGNRDIGGYRADQHLGTIDYEPRNRPEKLVAAARDHRDAEKLVVHLMQPHLPYYAGSDDDDPSRPEAGDPVSEWFDGYLTNLTYGWEEGVKPLLAEFDRPTVITADHGEGLYPVERNGTSGQRRLHGHNADYPGVRYVPWVKLNTGTGPTLDELPDVAEDRLRELGYLDR